MDTTAVSQPPRKRGRKHLGMEVTTLRLARATMTAIDKIVPNRQRTGFIRQAVDEKLAREARAKTKPSD